jgi:hypothetical protein
LGTASSNKVLYTSILNRIATWNLAEQLDDYSCMTLLKNSNIIGNLHSFVEHCGVKIDISQPLATYIPVNTKDTPLNHGS